MRTFARLLAAVLAGLLLAAPASPVTYAAAGDNPVVVGYYAGWAAYRGYTPDRVPAGLLTHLNYAFAAIDPARGVLALSDPAQDRENLAGLRALREQHPSLKLLISVGGWDDSTYFSDVASTAARREVFAQSCLDFILEHGLDGVDLDWEYPVSGGTAGVIHRPQDRRNFTLLLQAIRAKLDGQSRRDGKRYLLTIAGGAGEDYLRCIEPTAVAQLVDLIFLMAYDLHGPWDRYADFNAPLYAPSGFSPQYSASVSDSLRAWLNAGVPAGQLVLGMPLYGYCYQGAVGLYSSYISAVSVPYDTVVSQYLSNAMPQRHSDAQVPYLSGGGFFLTYDDEASIAAKAELAAAYDLAGVGFWELSQDSGAALVRSACRAFDGLRDVPAGEWYTDAVYAVTRSGWMEPLESGRFYPYVIADRGTIAAALHQMAGAPSAGAPPFPDVDPTATHAAAVAWAATAGVVRGYDDGRFAADDPVTREQLAVLMYRFAQSLGRATQGRASLSAYRDASAVSGYAQEAMSWAVAAGLLQGRGGGLLAPGGITTRAELAVILTRFASLL